MKRREFIVGLGGAALWPLTARAQQSDRMRRIGILMGYRESDPAVQLRLKSLLQGLGNLGWVEGRNLRIDYRWSASDLDRERAYAAELASIGPDLIVASPITTAVVVQRLTNSIPIVFVIGVEPVGLGYVDSLARPGGNLTGFSTYEPATGAKWLALLREIAPNLSRAIVLTGPNSRLATLLRPWLETAAQALNLQLTVSELHDDEETRRAFDEWSHAPNGGVVVLPNAFNSVHRALIISLAARHHLPAIYPFRFYAVDGGLMSYSVDEVELFGSSATYVDRILQGAKPADLPVQQPTKFELTINLKTAKALGLTIPETLLATADKLIE